MNWLRALKPKDLELKFMMSMIGVLITIGVCVAFAKDDRQPAKVMSLDDELKFKAGDEEGNEIKALKTELLISRNDEKAMEQLKKLLRKYKGSALEPSLHFRLAELFMRKAKTATFFEVHRDSSKVVQFGPKVVKSASSKGWVTKAVDTYDFISKKFTHYRDMDLVLFNNAFARQILGQDKLSMTLYRRLIEDYSESPLVPDSHLAIGENYFNNKQFQAAFDEFQKIRKFQDARVFPYGLYKGAWSLYNLRRTGEGLSQLEEVVAYSKSLTSSEEQGNKLDLTREALDDMVTFYEDVKRPSDAVAYFRNQGGDLRAGELVLKLGKLYQHHGRFKNLEIVYLDLIKAVPNAPERPEMHHDLMDSFEINHDRNRTIEHLEILSDLCNDKSNWSKLQKSEIVASCWRELEAAGKHYASKWHKEYKKLASNDLALLTSRSYEALLKNEQKLSDEDKLRFNYAELLFQRGEFRRASPQYSRVAVVSKDAKLRHDSSYAALVSLEKAVKDKWSDSDEREFSKLAQNYIRINPKGDFVTDVRFKMAFIAYEKGRYDESAPLLKDLALKFSTSERGLRAAHLYLDILNIQKKYESLRDESYMFTQKLKLDSKTRDEFVKIHEQASFTVVQKLESSQKWADAAAGYKEFQLKSPKSQLADKAVYNGIRCANLAGDLAEAAKLSELLIDKYPQSQFKIEIVKALVTLYEAQAQLGLAGRTLLVLSDMEPNKKWSNMLAAADYKALNNEWAAATQIYNQLAGKVGQIPEGIIAVERIHAFSEKNNQSEKANRILEQLVEYRIQPQASLASLKLALAAYREKNEEKAFKLAKKTLSMKSEKQVSSWAIAQARLLQGKILEKEFDAVGVKAKPERLSMVLAIKAEKLQNTQRAYQETISLGDRQTAIEALVRLAKCFEKFSSSLKTIEAPADAPEKDKKKFLAEIENMSLPLEEKNAETLQVALKQAKSLGLHDGTIAQIQGELNRLSRRAVRGSLAVEIVAPENVLPVVN